MTDEEKLGTADGRYGQVVEHPLIRGLFYMTVCQASQSKSVRAVVISDRIVRGVVGEIRTIASEGWIIVDD